MTDVIISGMDKETAEKIEARLNRPHNRNERQWLVAQWCVAAFGKEQMNNVEQRGLRLAEEAIEAAQVCKCDPKQLHALIDYVYNRPVGEMVNELGGVGLTLLALSHSAGYYADEAEQRELERVQSIPLHKFSERNQQKNDAGFKARPNK